jgi:hypothetical protein
MQKIGSRTIYAMAGVVLVAMVIGILLSENDRTPCAQVVCGDGHSDEAIVSDYVPESCTIFTSSYGDTVLFGNNEDWINPNTYYWVVPSRGGNYGAVYFGFDNFWPQGGINEKGLAFDVNALPKAVLNPHPELPKVKKPFYEFLKKCSTVEEVIDRVKDYSWGSSWRAQVHLADATGDAVVISVGPDGEIAFTRKQKGNGYLISTNFNRANPKNGRYPCWRYDTTVAMLKEIQSEDDHTADRFRSILDAVHQEGPLANTVYSNVFDLKHCIIYLYHWHQFDEVVILNVAEELAKAPSPTRIRDLFSHETVNQASKEYLAYQKKITPWKNVSWAWLLLAAGSLVVLIWDLAHGTQAPWGMRLAWLFVVALFGPLGLIAYVYSYRQPMRSPELQAAVATWRCALGETVFAVAGYAIGIILAFFTLYFILSFSESSIWSIVARFYGLPLIVGLFLFHAPLVGFVVGNRYWTAVRRRFLTEVISLNFVLMGMLPVSGILMSLFEKYLGMRGPGSVLFWGVITLGAFGGALTVYPFNTWKVHRGFCCWPVHLFTDGEIEREESAMAILPLRNAWGALPLSFALLIGSIVMVFSSVG